jgi:hypothetical protein
VSAGEYAAMFQRLIAHRGEAAVANDLAATPAPFEARSFVTPDEDVAAKPGRQRARRRAAGDGADRTAERP